MYRALREELPQLKAARELFLVGESYAGVSACWSVEQHRRVRWVSDVLRVFFRRPNTDFHLVYQLKVLQV